MNRIATRAAAVVALFASGACARSDAAPRWQATVDTVGDTITVRTVAGSLWGDEARLVPELEIGELEGDDAYLLGSIRGLAVGPGDDIYAIDTQVPALRKYSPTGEHLLDLGRQGGGPGEYGRPDGGLAVLQDGRVLLRDPGNARINVYSPAGQDLGGWRLPSGGSFNTSRRLYVDREGNTYTLVLRDREADATAWRYGLARFAPDGTHADTLPAPEYAYEAPIVFGRSEGNTSSTNVPFSPVVSWAFSPFGYMVGGLSTDYRIELFRRDAPLLRIERAWQPVAVGADEKANAGERITFNMRGNFPGWRWNGPSIPDTKPPFRSVFVGDDGRIWLLLYQPGVEVLGELEAKREQERTRRMPVRFLEPVVFDVFEPDGRYLGRVRAPDGFATAPEPVFRGDRVWAVARDSLDVARITRYRIERGPGS